MIERLVAVDGVGGVRAWETAARGVHVTAGDLTVEVWRPGHWVAARRGRTCGTGASIPHGGQFLAWVADRIDEEHSGGRV